MKRQQWNSTLKVDTEKKMKRSRLKKRNARRMKKRQEEAFGPKADYIRKLPCCVCGTIAPSDPHHVKSRGAGGKARDLVPLCWNCHLRLHNMGRLSFELENSVDLGAIAKELEQRWQSERTAEHD